MKVNPMQVLSAEEILEVHHASLRVLHECGVRILSERVLRLLEEKGVEIDWETKTARFSPEQVEASIRLAPATFDLFTRDGERAFTIGDRVPHCAAGHNAIFCIHPATLERRYATVQDVREFGMVSDKMTTIDIVGVPLNPIDVPAKSTLLHAAKALFETTSKPLFFSTESREVVKSLIEMMKAAVGRVDIQRSPNAILQLSPSSPLFWDGNTVEGVLECALAGVPLAVLPEPMSGVSAPYSVAGLLTENNIEFLSGLVIAQLLHPGLPVIYASSWTTYDMKYSCAQIASPETTMLRIAGCQMARFYGIPSHTTATNTDSNAYDEQHAWESVLSNMAALFSENDIVMNSGMFASGLTTSLEQLVMDNEMNSYLKRIMRSTPVDRNSIAEEVIKSVGPQGNFLMEDHTIQNLRSGEFYEPTIRVNLTYQSWQEDGAPTVEIYAGAIAKQILARGNDQYPGDALMTKLDAVIAEFERANPS